MGLCALTTFVLAAATWMTLTAAGDTGVALQPAGVPFIDRITSVDSGSPAAVAGLRVDDTLDIRDLSPGDRLRALAVPVAGKAIVLRIRRAGVRHTVSVMPRLLTQGTFWHADGWDQLLSMVGEFWSVFVAALIVWRRRESLEAALLALCLILENLGTALSPSNFWITPWPALDLAAYTLSWPISAVGNVLLATYALQFARPVSRTRLIVTRCVYATAALSTLVNGVGVVGGWLGAIDMNGWFWAQPAPSLVISLTSPALSLTCAALALGAARGTERTRLAWASGSLGVLYIAFMIFATTTTLGTFVHAGTILVDVAVFVAPLGLTYALLNRRLLDVGFVVNRAAIYTVLTGLLIGTLAGLNWLIGSALKSTGLALPIAVVLAAGVALSLQAVQRRVTVTVDRVLFRQRYESEQRLARLARAIPHMSDDDALTEALVAEPVRTLQLAAGALYRRCEDGSYQRSATTGWPNDAPATIAAADPLVIHVTGAMGGLVLDDVVPEAAFPNGPLRPRAAFAVPGPDGAAAIVLYAAHLNGSTLDPDESMALERLATAASVAFERSRVRSTERRLDDVLAALGRLEKRLDA